MAVIGYYKEEIEEIGGGGTDQDENEVFESPSASVPGVMGWLTGSSQHEPISRGNFEIAVYFDHDCLKNKLRHSVCFPAVSTCAKSITFPVQHIQSTESVIELFILAY